MAHPSRREGEVVIAPTLSRRLTSETLGTALLVATVVGSGIMAERLFPSSVGLMLVANTMATGAGLVALILAFGDISAHFNPAVSVWEFLNKRLSAAQCGAYVIAQIAGGLAGVAAAHAMFGVPILQFSGHVRTGQGLWISEGIATFGLLLVIAGGSRASRAATAVAVGAYITAAYWFTASTSFANPAVTIARAFTMSFSGIRPADVAGFLLAQAAGTAAAFALLRWLRPSTPEAGA